MKKIPGCELRATFEGCFFMFSWAKKKIYNFFLHFRVCTKMLLDTKVKKKFKKLGSIFGESKTGFFRASCFGFRIKGVCLLLLPLVSLVTNLSRKACNQKPMN
jgi:hypothetical protein